MADLQNIDIDGVGYGLMDQEAREAAEAAESAATAAQSAAATASSTASSAAATAASAATAAATAQTTADGAQTAAETAQTAADAAQTDATAALAFTRLSVSSIADLLALYDTVGGDRVFSASSSSACTAEITGTSESAEIIGKFIASSGTLTQCDLCIFTPDSFYYGSISSDGTVTLNLDSDALTAAYLKAPNVAGYSTDQYGNFKHQRTTVSDNFCFFANDGTITGQYYFETGVLRLNGNQVITALTGDIGMYFTTCAGQLSNTRRSVYFFIPIQGVASSSTISFSGNWYIRSSEGNILTNSTLDSIGTVTYVIRPLGIDVRIALTTQSSYTNNIPVTVQGNTGATMTIS